MKDSLSLKTVILMATSFLFSMMLWDSLVRDYYYSLLEKPTFLETGFGYLIIASVFVIFFLFLNKKFSSEESSESEY